MVITLDCQIYALQFAQGLFLVLYLSRNCVRHLINEFLLVVTSLGRMIHIILLLLFVRLASYIMIC